VRVGGAIESWQIGGFARLTVAFVTSVLSG
jgi:hypothetical protein